MKKENVIDFGMYWEERNASATPDEAAISEELKHAIEHLILRLKELGPLF